MSITHGHLAADPGTTDADSVTRAGVARLLLLEKVQAVFGADGGPLRKQPVMLVCQCSAAAHGDQSRVALGWQDRHEFILSRHPAQSPRPVPHDAPPATRSDRPSPNGTRPAQRNLGLTPADVSLGTDTFHETATAVFRRPALVYGTTSVFRNPRHARLCPAAAHVE